MTKVLVYLTTYNGQDYIREQLDSIFAQKNVSVSILVGDDGSTDNTLEILEEYRKKGRPIKIIRNPTNLGYRRNFMSLIQRPIEDTYDYFALSDQDDVWLEDKLSSAVETHASLSLPEDVPFLYSSNLQCVDQKLEPISLMFPKRLMKMPPLLRLLKNTNTGCTSVFNAALRGLLLAYPLDFLWQPHDEIIAQIALLTGTYFLDPIPHILYRQHGRNQIGMEKKERGKYQAFLSGKRKSYHSDSLALIFSLYKERIDEKKRRYVMPITNYKNRFSSRLRILFSWRYRRTGFKEFFAFKGAILLKKY